MVEPEEIRLRETLDTLGISREKLIWIGLLVGTDFNEGVMRVGPKTALKLIRSHGSLEALPERYRKLLPSNIAELRDIFLHPSVTDAYSVDFTELRDRELIQFLTMEREFSKDRVTLALERMRQFHARQRSTLTSWLAKN